MPKLIVHYPSDVSPEIALTMVAQVCEEGRISKARGLDQFCHVTTFKTSHGRFVVHALPRRSETSAETFRVEREKND